ncbi:MAG: hypothetical protein COA47_02340 [Robiginitomaculum sp.]|nr:MAG: hypothetical protein COA47_02340 [Robiginitomaculum sp.]
MEVLRVKPPFYLLDGGILAFRFIAKQYGPSGKKNHAPIQTFVYSSKSCPAEPFCSSLNEPKNRSWIDEPTRGK